MAIGAKWYFESPEWDSTTNTNVFVVSEVEITGETPRKWTWTEHRSEHWTGEEWSIPKAGSDVREARRQSGSRVWTKMVYASHEALERAKVERNEKAWANTHRWRIGKAVECLADPNLLRQIAALVGYKETP